MERVYINDLLHFKVDINQKIKHFAFKKSLTFNKMSQQREIDISRKGFPSRSIPEPLPIFTVNMEIAHEVPSYEGVISGSVPSSPVIRQALPIPDIPPPIYSGREAKPANTLIRWNLLFTFLILLFVSSAFWIPFIPKIQKFSMEIVVIILAFLHLLWLIAVINNFRYLFRLRKFKSHQINLSRVCIISECLEMIVLIVVISVKHLWKNCKTFSWNCIL